MPDPDPRGYELAYDEGVRALSQQQAVLDNFRTRPAPPTPRPEPVRPSPMKPEGRGGNTSERR